MGEEHPFRLILILGSVILLPIVAYHRLKSRAAGDSLDRRQEGLFMLVTLRPVGILCMLGLVAYIVDPTSMAWSSMELPRWLRWTGVGLGLIAGSVLIWTFRSLGPNLTDTVVTRREHTLVTAGPYRVVCHPFYLSVALAIAASSLTAASWLVLGSGAAALVLIAIRTRKEEEFLIARFGDAYRTYMERTGRFVPMVFRRRGDNATRRRDSEA